MKRIVLLASILLFASLAAAEERVLLIAPEDVDTFSYEGRSISSILLDLDADLTAKVLVSASLVLRLSGDEEASTLHTEIQVASWESGAPVAPAGKFRPVTKVIAGTDAAIISVDVRPIFQPLFDAGGAQSLRLALGRLYEWDEDSRAGILSALNPDENVLARLEFHVQ